MLIPVHPEHAVIFNAHLVARCLECLREGIPGLPVVVMESSEPLVGLVGVANMKHPQDLLLAIAGVGNIQHPVLRFHAGQAENGKMSVQPKRLHVSCRGPAEFDKLLP